VQLMNRARKPEKLYPVSFMLAPLRRILRIGQTCSRSYSTGSRSQMPGPILPDAGSRPVHIEPASPEVARQQRPCRLALRVGRLVATDMNQPCDVAMMGVAEHRKGLV
jgi:hypothetical protein